MEGKASPTVYRWGRFILAAYAARTAIFSAMAAPATILTCGAVLRPFAGCMMFVEIVRVTRESGSKGGNGHQGCNSKHSFHNEGI